MDLTLPPPGLRGKPERHYVDGGGHFYVIWPTATITIDCWRGGQTRGIDAISEEIGFYITMVFDKGYWSARDRTENVRECEIVAFYVLREVPQNPALAVIGVSWEAEKWAWDFVPPLHPEIEVERFLKLFGATAIAEQPCAAGERRICIEKPEEMRRGRAAHLH